jgi:dimethylhistidine N-methyltransferase
VEPETDAPRESAAAERAPRHPELVRIPGPPAEQTARFLRACLAAPQVSIPPRYFYDDLGSRLFAAITVLPEYYPTRTEAALLERHLPAIVAAAPVEGCTLLDLGAGNCEKAARLFAALHPACYVAIDIASDFLGASLECLQRQFPRVRMLGVATDFSARLALPAEVPRGRRLCFYPGSSIGNFTPAEATAFLRSIRAELGRDGVLWIGVDLVKDVGVLERAYDDALGVTAAFNLNVLRVLNRLAGADFEIGSWRHVAFFDAAASRIEMHLEAARDVIVRWPDGERRFRAGERIHTENSYKHTPDGFRALLAAAGFESLGCWSDERAWFGFFVAAPAEAR